MTSLKKHEVKWNLAMTQSKVPVRAPRIDPLSFQARVPVGVLRKEDCAPPDDHPEVKLMCTGEWTERIVAYLDFCRKLTRNQGK
jgi:hypothetical protein